MPRLVHHWRTWFFSLILWSLAGCAMTSRQVTGRVMDDSQRPAAGAIVTLIRPGGFCEFKDGVLNTDPPQLQCVADTTGRFAFDLGDFKIGAIAVYHERGGLIVDPSHADLQKPLVLIPFAHYSGIVKIGSKIAVGEIVEAQQNLDVPLDEYGNVTGVTFTFTTRADARGRYTLPAMPGENWVGLMNSVGPNARDWVEPHRYEVKQGQAAVVDFGGVGRPLIGQLALPDGITLSAARGYLFLLELAAPREPEPPWPADSVNWDAQRQKEFQRAWQTSDAGKQAVAGYLASQMAQRQYRFRIDPQGAFRVDDVRPGRYSLSVVARGVDNTLEPAGTQCRLELETTVAVAAIPGGETDVPQSLDNLALARTGSVRIGGVAPDFDLPTLDGRHIQLSSLRGKYVLLDFWATWCAICIQQMPYLKSVNDRFGADPRFVLLGVDGDQTMEPALRCMTANAMGWTDAFAGEWSRSAVHTAYGFDGLPHILLIGPDGRVLATELRSSDILAAVSKALVSDGHAAPLP